MEKTKFTYYPNPLLRMKASPVDFNGKPPDEILHLLQTMRDILSEHDGIGLAAQQIGLVKPIMVFGIPNTNGGYKLVGVVNPSIVEQGKIASVREEGCLSFPGLYFPVARPQRIIVEGWFDDAGAFARRELLGMAARVFCHEHDHINGVLFIDRADASTKIKIKPELQRIAQKEHSN